MASGGGRKDFFFENWKKRTKWEDMSHIAQKQKCPKSPRRCPQLGLCCAFSCSEIKISAALLLLAGFG
jgi:hypothetical protein